MIIGLSGYARSGKDTAAEGLQEIGFQRVAFADKLREFLYALNPMIEPELGASMFPWIRLQQIIDVYGWNGYKQTPYGPEIRQLLQRLGTECGREIISDTIWIDAALGGVCTCEGKQANVCHDIRNEPHLVGCPRWGMPRDIVVTDCRFPNEAQAINDRGGYIVRIERPGVKPVNPHPSETSLDDWEFDARLLNDGDVLQLHSAIQNIFRHFKAVEGIG